jgi:hypothetical protein
VTIAALRPRPPRSATELVDGAVQLVRALGRAHDQCRDRSQRDRGARTLLASDVAQLPSAQQTEEGAFA